MAMMLPEATRTLQAIYRTVSDAAKAVSKIMAQPIVPCALEFIDGNAIQMIRGYSVVDLPEKSGALLMIEVDGTLTELSSAAEKVAASARNSGLLDVRSPPPPRKSKRSGKPAKPWRRLCVRSRRKKSTKTWSCR